MLSNHGICVLLHYECVMKWWILGKARIYEKCLLFRQKGLSKIYFSKQFQTVQGFRIMSRIWRYVITNEFSITGKQWRPAGPNLNQVSRKPTFLSTSTWWCHQSLNWTPKLEMQYIFNFTMNSLEGSTHCNGEWMLIGIHLCCRGRLFRFPQ